MSKSKVRENDGHKGDWSGECWSVEKLRAFDCRNIQQRTVSYYARSLRGVGGSQLGAKWAV